MAKTTETVTVRAAGREVAVTNAHKMLFPEAGHTKLDLVRYYLAVADGALRAAGGRPNMLVRYPDGVGGEFFYQKRAPKKRPDWIDVVELRFPSGRTAEEVVPRSAADLAWLANLACLELHPHPVRAERLEHPDELRVDLDPVPGVEWPQVREVGAVVREALEDVGLRGWPKTSGKRGLHVYVRIEPRWTFDEVRRAALALARDVERRAPSLATSAWWKEERHGVFVDYNQNAKDRTMAAAYSVRPTPDARVSAPITWNELPDCEPRDFTMASMEARFAERGDVNAGIDREVGSLEALLELSARHEREGQGDAPWPPHYAKGRDEPPRVQPSKRRAANETRAESSTTRSVEKNTPAKASATRFSEKEAQAESAMTQSAEEKTTAKRRIPKHPLIEIGRARREADALEGFERWKRRHPDAARHLEPADVLVDSMRGRSSTWTRVRVNLRHVPAAARPEQEPLDPDEPDLTGTGSKRGAPPRARRAP